jgi:Arc/MetJ family transcription regulator
MPTNLAIDDRLLDEARKIGQHPTKKSTVNTALKEYIQRRREQEIIDLFGKIEYDPDYNYKQARQR